MTGTTEATPELRHDAPVFTPAATAFFRDLARDDTREFFTAHRDRYDSAVRAPMEALLAHAEAHWGDGRVTRPNRDLRFTPDKSPYRLSASLWAHRDGAGVYLELAEGGLEAGGGMHDPSRDQLARARAAIAHGGRATDELRTILGSLTGAGFTLAGPSLTTAPRGYPRDHPHIELLRLQRYAALRHLPLAATLAEIDTAWQDVAPLGEWAVRHAGGA